MKFEIAVIICLLLLCYGACAPIGWSPALLGQDASVSNGPLAGVATSADPGLVYSWLMRLFSQKAFLSWLGKSKPVMKSPSKSSSASLSTTTTVKSPNVERIESDIPTIIRDYETSSIATSAKSATATKESTPRVARDFSGNNLVIIARTQKSMKTTDGIQLTNLPIQVQEMGATRQQTLSSSPSKATKGTTSETIEVVRDYYHEGDYNIESGNLNNQSPSPIPFVEINNGKIDSNNPKKSTGSSNSATTLSPVSQSVPEGLQIARDKMESTTGSTQSQPEVVTKKQPDGLVVIRDIIEDESQDPYRVIPTDSGNSEVRMKEATIKPGSNLVLLLPKKNFKFFG